MKFFDIKTEQLEKLELGQLQEMENIVNEQIEKCLLDNLQISRMRVEIGCKLELNKNISLNKIGHEARSKLLALERQTQKSLNEQHDEGEEELTKLKKLQNQLINLIAMKQPVLNTNENIQILLNK